MNLAIGDKIRWECMAGSMVGTIKNIVLRTAANDKVTPWIDVEYSLTHKTTGVYHTTTTRICASDSYLKIMRVSKFDF